MTDRMSGSRRCEARCFNENSPRPPAIGGETGTYIGRIPPQSPALTPRRSLLGRTSSGYCDASAPMGFEPEGCCDSSIMEGNSQPACLRWATNLNSLLQDREGLQLFRKYLEQEGTSHANPLDFYFACEGLNQEHDKDKVHQLIKAINRRFLQKAQLAIPEHIRKEANRRVKEGRADKTVFDAVQHEVERVIKETIYPNFLSSEIYCGYVTACQNAESAGCPSSGSSREMSISCGPAQLPTLHEDAEYFTTHYSHSACGTPGELRLTKDVLIRTQQARAMDLRPKTEAHVGMYLHPATSPYHMRSRAPLQYSSYNPVSRQDSELQSLSSDARTESDNLSLTDNSVDGMSMRASRSIKKQHARDSKVMRNMANMNPEPLAQFTVIPRTQRVAKDICVPTDPAILGPILIEKLEAVKRAQECEEKLNRHLQEAEINSMEGPPSTALADALREKLQIEDDDQAILDQHVSRVWSDPTPSRSPRFESPRGHSPERCKRNVSTHNYTRSHKQRKEKDGISMFSIDSGNINDFPEDKGSDMATAGSFSSLGSHIPKSKSVPSEYADSLHKAELYYQGHEQRFRRADMSRRSATKKSMTELTDSGVSVVSSVPPVPSKEYRNVMWVHQSEKKSESKPHRHGKRYGSRSGSLERPIRESWGVPGQPLATDPGMPRLAPPDTAEQLEEVNRRLEEQHGVPRVGSRNLVAGSNAGTTCRKYSASLSTACTLRKKQGMADFTTAVVSFCDENVPYRIKIPGHNVTLKQFKEYLPKKGSYRYFFTTECEDVDIKIIQEEITDDTEVLPLWEGKIKAQVKALE